MISKNDCGSWLCCGEEHLRFGELILEVELRILYSESNQSYLLQVLNVDWCLVNVAFILGVRGAVIIVAMSLFTAVEPVMVLVLTVLHVNEICLSEPLILKTCDKVMNNEFKSLLSVEEPDTLDINHVLN